MVTDNVDQTASPEVPPLTLKVSTGPGYQVLELDPALDKTHCKSLEKNIPKLVSENNKPWIISCIGIVEFPQIWTRILAIFCQEFKKKQLEVRFAFVSQKLNQSINTAGLSKVFVCFPNLGGAVRSLGLPPPKAFDVEFINPFLSVTMKVFKTVIGTDAQPGKLFVEKSKSSVPKNISGLIGVTSFVFSGVIIVSFTDDVTVKVMSRFLNKEVKKIDSEVEFAFLEFTKLIFNQAKTILEEKGYGIRPAIPTLATGASQQYVMPEDAIRVIVPFTTEFGVFHIEICTLES